MRLHLLVARGVDEQHRYDVGTRETYGYARLPGERPRFLEDYVEDYEFVKILEHGPEYYRGETDDAIKKAEEVEEL